MKAIRAANPGNGGEYDELLELVYKHWR